MSGSVPFIDFTTFMNSVALNRTDTYTQKAAAIVNAFEQQLNANIQTIQTQLSQYQTLYINYSNTNELYLQYQEENETLDKTLKKSSGDILTNHRKTYYKEQQKNKLDYTYYSLWMVYILLLGYFFFMMIRYQRYSIRYLGLFLVFIGLPFVSSYVLYILGMGLHLIKKLIMPSS